MANNPITIDWYTNVPAPGSPIQSAWTQQITAEVVNDHKHVQVGPTAFAAASATNLGGSFGSITLPEKGLWMIAVAGDAHPTAGGWGYVDIWPSTAGDGSSNGLALFGGKLYEQTGFNIRAAMSGLFLFDAGPGAVALRCKTFASSCAFDGSLMTAWRLHKSYV